MGGRYGHAGAGRMERISENPEDQEVGEPSSVSLPASEDQVEEAFRCTAPVDDDQKCGRDFKKKMLVARHFNSSHDDLKEDADSWREYYEEVAA